MLPHKLCMFSYDITCICFASVTLFKFLTPINLHIPEIKSPSYFFWSVFVNGESKVLRVCDMYMHVGFTYARTRLQPYHIASGSRFALSGTAHVKSYPRSLIKSGQKKDASCELDRDSVCKGRFCSPVTGGDNHPTQAGWHCMREWQSLCLVQNKEKLHKSIDLTLTRDNIVFPWMHEAQIFHFF